MSAPTLIDESVLLPDLLRRAPQVRPVLDRYGLRGCGGENGPAESLGFFARAHDVPVHTLLAEVRAAAEGATPAPAPAPRADALADSIYRPFFKAGIAVVLTLGAAWGAYLLLRIGLTGSFTAVGIHEVNAHGHAQIFGWLGLFVMGFAYQAFPRFRHTNLPHPRLALASLVLMLAGLVLRSVLEPIATQTPWLTVIALVGSAFELIAVLLFAWILAATWRTSRKPLAAHDGYIFAAVFWFVVQAVYDAVYFAATVHAADRAQLLDLVATWQPSLRTVQVHGFALLMVLGVSQRLFHHFYGFPMPSRAVSLLALVGLNVAILGELSGSLLMRLAGHGWAALWYASVLLLAITVVTLVSDWRIFSRPIETDRSLKFLRAAYLWLFVSLGMLILLPVYQHTVLALFAPESEAARLGFSHAYYGAVRHAITVGFLSLMIVGVAAKVVPTLNGLNVHSLPGLWVPFVLINTGCALRVMGQVATDFTPDAYPLAGASGLLEVTGLAIWGIHLWRIMSRGPTSDMEGPAAEPLVPGQPILATHRVGEVLDTYPDLLPLFVDRGFTPLHNAVLRKLVARRVTIAHACRLLGVDAAALLHDLNAAAGLREKLHRSLPVLEGACCPQCRR